MILGTIGALGQGGLLPVQFVIFGGLVDDFIEYTMCIDPKSNCSSIPNIEEAMIPFAYFYIGIAVAMAVVIALQMVMWGLTRAFFKNSSVGGPSTKRDHTIPSVEK